LPLNDDFEIVVDDYKQANGGIIITNPNAPTSIALGLAQLKKYLQANPDSVVVIDEAYVDFGAESAVQLVEKYEKL
jgi:histidinol-phosphate aminotransferase